MLWTSGLRPGTIKDRAYEDVRVVLGIVRNGWSRLHRAEQRERAAVKGSWDKGWRVNRHLMGPEESG